MHSISQTVDRKFVDQVDLSDWEILSDDGWQPCVQVSKTIPYQTFELQLANGLRLECADTHIVFDDNFTERFVKDLKPNDLVQTVSGLSAVVSVTATDQHDHMYDVSVHSHTHRYWTNGILSHNTTTAGGYLLWYASFNQDTTILIAANKFKAANEIMMRIKYAYEELPNFLRPGVIEYNVQSIRFDNGSRIVASTTTPDSGRGMSISLLYLDEFAWIKNPRVAEEFWTAMSPTLATGGKCIITSTPKSDEDMFSKIWFQAITTIDENGNEIPDGVGINGFKAFSAHYSQVPGRDEEWADRERIKIGDDRFKREYECQFAGEESTLINSMTLSRLRGIDPINKTGDIRWYDKPVKDKTYLIALDPSAGIGKDAACIEVWSLPDMMQVAEWVNNKTSIPLQVKNLHNIVNNIYNEIKKQNVKGEPEIYFTVENNSWGEAALQTIADIGEENFQGQFLHEPRRVGMFRPRKGLNTNGRTKAMACTKLKSLVESSKLKIQSKLLIKQLKYFVSKGDSFAAKPGENDDCVMATLLCIRMMMMVTSWDDKVGEMMKDIFEGEDGSHRDPMPFSVIIR